MLETQRQHARHVMQLAAGDLRAAADPQRPRPRELPEARDLRRDTPDALILDSWSRCLHEYKLDPSRSHEAVILPSERVREHRDRMDEFLRIARHGLEELYAQVAGMGYCVLLSDARGVTVDFIGDIQVDASLRRAGLYLGSDWNERHAGTCGVGTAITTGRALIVHQDDHFDPAHIALTCTAVPLHDPLGRLLGVLDLSALSSPRAKSTQRWALQFLTLNAQRVENANFLRWFRKDWIVKAHPTPEFVEISPDYLIALDAGGRIIGHNRAAQRLLEAQTHSTVLGLPFEQFFELPFAQLGAYQRSAAGERRGVRFGTPAQRLFVQSVPPPSPVRALASRPPAGAPLPPPLARLSGGDAATQRQLERAARLLDSPISLLLGGETGSGKEFLARALHESGPRADKPFVAVNCAAIPESLIESELFGHLAGSFSGAMARGRRGLILEAHGGTLFLDEIGDMPPALQPRLLRVLAEREVLPVGASRPTPVDVRVIAATHADLDARVRDGSFRADLYYRLAGAQLRLPPLRERSDLAWLVERMLAGAEPAVRISEPALERLRAWPWPGNLRELRNTLDYATAVCSDGVIEPWDLPDAIAGAPDGAQYATAARPATQAHDALLQALRRCRGNVTQAARLLGVSRMTLYRRMQRLGVHRDWSRD